MDHAVAVGAEDGQIDETSRGFPGRMERRDVVSLDVPIAHIAVRGTEIEPTHLAGERPVGSHDGLDLSLPQLGIAFTPVMDRQDDAALSAPSSSSMSGVVPTTSVPVAEASSHARRISRAIADIGSGLASKASAMRLLSAPPLVAWPG